MDTQIWYAIFSTLIGGIYGACRRLGEVGAHLFTHVLLSFFFCEKVVNSSFNLKKINGCNTLYLACYIELMLLHLQST